MSDRAPTVYLPDGTPVKVRLVGHECEGNVSGEGHFGYRPTTIPEEEPTVFFEKARGEEPGFVQRVVNRVWQYLHTGSQHIGGSQ